MFGSSSVIFGNRRKSSGQLWNLRKDSGLIRQVKQASEKEKRKELLWQSKMQNEAAYEFQVDIVEPREKNTTATIAWSKLCNDNWTNININRTQERQWSRWSYITSQLRITKAKNKTILKQKTGIESEPITFHLSLHYFLNYGK